MASKRFDEVCRREERIFLTKSITYRADTSLPRQGRLRSGFGLFCNQYLRRLFIIS